MSGNVISHDSQLNEIPELVDGAIQSTSLLPIIGIGASAGGLSALETLFEQIPSDTSAAFVVIQHLSPDYQSHMAELLSRRTSMKTVEMSEGVTPQPNTIYLLPPGKHVEIEGDHLNLLDRAPSGDLNLPIDRFFQSLARQVNRRFASVVLSGTGSDGSVGVQDVARRGGLVLCQDEDSAQFNGMPLNAIKTQAVHVVGTVPEIAESLASYIRGASIDEVVAQSSPTIDRNDLAPIYELLEASTGVDFHSYKHGTFSRRLSRRMLLRDAEQLHDYVGILQRDPAEVAKLNDDLLIGVTRFFRDPDGYQRLCNRVIRPAVRGKVAGDELRVWVAGCATGQEAYSIAMLLHSEKEKHGVEFTIKIFATDVHPDAIRFAQRGVYPNESMAEIPKEFRDKFLQAVGDGFEICKEIRNSIVFARHDVMRDAPFANLDLVTCRNLLIYLLDDAQQRVLASFAHALKTRGVLWLGPSETPGDVTDGFSALDKHWRLFQKERDLSLPLDLKLRKRPFSNASLSLRPRPSRSVAPSMVLSYDRILDLFAPPGILIDENSRPLQTFGNLSGITSPPTGRLSGTVEDFVIAPLQTPIAMTLQRMRANQSSQESETAFVNGERLEIVVRSLSHPTINETHYLITFGRNNAAGLRSAVKDEKAVEACATSDGAINHSLESHAVGELGIARLPDERTRMLEMELEFTRENLQATIEELETTNEELQSSNEELTSSNEELQSTNEELHSVNEELHTTNAESERRVQLLSELTADLESVMRESDIGIVLIDDELKIRRITPAAADLLAIRSRNPQGESLLAYSDSFNEISLPAIIEEVHERREAVEHETTDRRGEPILLRVTPYRDGRGTILTMTSLRVVKENADKIRKLTSIVMDSTDAIIGVELNGTITSWNRGAAQLFGQEVEPNGNLELCDVLPEEICEFSDRALRELPRKSNVSSEEVTLRQGPNKQKTLLVRVTPVLDELDRVSAAALTIYDVTQLRYAQSQLELRTRAIDASKSGIIIADALADDMPIIYCNQGFEEISGYQAVDVRGRNCRFMQGAETDPADVETIREAIRNRTGCRVTILNYRRDGKAFYNDLILTPVHDANGQVTHYVGIQHDITEVVQTNRRLEQSEAEYRRTFENAAVGIAHVGMDGEWQRVNEKLCQIIGYRKEELESKTFQELTFSEDLERDLQQFSLLKRGSVDGYSIEKRYVHRDGHLVWANLTVSLRRDNEGKPECCISIIEDISDRKETERKLNESRAIITEVIETSEDAFVSFDRDGLIQVANRSAAEIAGKKVSELIGRSYEVLFDGDTNSPLLSTLDRVRRSQKPEATEYLATKLNRWYDTRVFPVVGGAALFMSDVTTRKETEAHLERARLAAEDASRAKSQFLTNMSHEIRSPMSAILGFSDIALRDIREGKTVQAQHLETVIRNGRFLLRIINDILDLSKVEAGKLEVRKSRFQLVPMLADIMELMRHRSESSGVPLTLEFATPIPERIYSDRSRVEQILVNLIGNALKFTPQGDVRVVVRFDANKSGTLELLVIDTGIGISEANLGRLFQSFSQVHGIKVIGVEGTGLGLVISKRLSALLGGDIEVQSVDGEGSTFKLTLPIEDAMNQQLIAPTADDIRPRKSPSKELGRLACRVLVADDARDIRLVTKHFLSRAGAEVVEANNGADAITKVREAESQGRPFKCVLMDMQMPELDGREATRSLREQGYTMPIIALTAGATSDEVREALSAGCTQFMSKPVDGPELVSRVAMLTLENRQ